MSMLFKGLKKSLEEALAYAEGKIALKSEIIEIPEPPIEPSIDTTNKQNDQRRKLAR